MHNNNQWVVRWFVFCFLLVALGCRLVVEAATSRGGGEKFLITVKAD